MRRRAPAPSEQTSAPGAPAANAAAAGDRSAARPLGLAASFGQYLRTRADAVHSGSGRTRPADNNTDYYPVPLKEETLRPGTVYHDPYGHVLMIVRRVAQIGGRGRNHSRGRRPARRHGGAQALLARQFPVRAGSGARRPRLQALPPDRARQERRAAAAEQRRDREESAIRRFLARAVASWGSKTSTTAWTT